MKVCAILFGEKQHTDAKRQASAMFCKACERFAKNPGTTANHGQPEQRGFCAFFVLSALPPPPLPATHSLNFDPWRVCES